MVTVIDLEDGSDSLFVPMYNDSPLSSRDSHDPKPSSNEDQIKEPYHDHPPELSCATLLSHHASTHLLKCGHQVKAPTTLDPGCGNTCFNAHLSLPSRPTFHYECHDCRRPAVFMPRKSGVAQKSKAIRTVSVWNYGLPGCEELDEWHLRSLDHKKDRVDGMSKGRPRKVTGPPPMPRAVAVEMTREDANMEKGLQTYAGAEAVEYVDLKQDQKHDQESIHPVIEAPRKQLIGLNLPPMEELRAMGIQITVLTGTAVST
ncbi:hypothetical protein BDZ85DRAFT_282752 [Elsinoe ampelina]|uniref:Uncharacterized protein n=1 Tax=Elsinoe ampelina TaxID=302913 RepID=A0A6A6GAF2_9PEZI|nr:hypothetical protein BDZ85DRAFT_282752 [Elsinoe ampelina]